MHSFNWYFIIHASWYYRRTWKRHELGDTGIELDKNFLNWCSDMGKFLFYFIFFRLTRLYWILLMSRADWGIPGNLCLRMSKMVSALSSKSSLFSKLTAEPQADFPSFWFIFLFQITMDASILFLRSRTLCSDDMSMVERNCSRSKDSTVMFL